MDLSGRSAIITGASQGLGSAIARRFVEAGASVLLVARGKELLDRTQAELAALTRLPGQRVVSMTGDVSRRECCEAIVAFGKERFTNITILVNNAGVYGPMGLIEQVDWQEWVEAIQINLFGTVLMCQAVLPIMRANNYGKIINLSGGGATAPLPRFSAYAASKVAVVRLTETFSEELRGTHVDINAISPGALNTRLLDSVLAAGPDKVGRDFYERSLRQQSEGGAPLDKAAALATFLASAASDGISGRLLSALWDPWDRLPQWQQELTRSDIYTLRRIIPEERGKAW